MAVKTITIDLEAYEALSRHKTGGQSFSQVIKEHFTRRRTGRDLAEVVASLRVSPATLQVLEEQVAERHQYPARSVEL